MARDALHTAVGEVVRAGRGPILASLLLAGLMALVPVRHPRAADTARGESPTEEGAPEEAVPEEAERATGSASPVASAESPSREPTEPARTEERSVVLSRVFGEDACEVGGVGVCVRGARWGMTKAEFLEGARGPGAVRTCEERPGADAPLVGEWRNAISEVGGYEVHCTDRYANCFHERDERGPAQVLARIASGQRCPGNLSYEDEEDGEEDGARRAEVVAYEDRGGRGLAAVSTFYRWRGEFDPGFFFEKTLASHVKRLGRPAWTADGYAVFLLEGPGERARVRVGVGMEDGLPVLWISTQAITLGRTDESAKELLTRTAEEWRDRRRRELRFSEAEFASYAFKVARRDARKDACNALRHVSALRFLPETAREARGIWSSILKGVLAGAESARQKEAAGRREGARRTGGAWRKNALAAVDEWERPWREASGLRASASRAAASSNPASSAGKQVAWSGIVGQRIREKAWIVHAPDGDFVFETASSEELGGLEYVVVQGTPGRERKYDFDGVRDVPKLSGRVWASRRRDRACSLEP